MTKGQSTRLRASVLVNRTAEECYRYWRNFENLPHFMGHVQTVEVIDPIRSHWVVDAPADTTAEWDAEITEDHSDQKICWRSTTQAQVVNEGCVEFRPEGGGRHTLVRVEMTYEPPLGALGKTVLKVFGESPDAELTDDLTRFKEAVEQEEEL